MTDIALTVERSPERPRDAIRTRDAILRAAQTLFAEKGYATTGVRMIATQAGVNSALVRRYFGSKQGLLRAALEPLLNIEALIAGDRAGFGERVATGLLKAGDITNPVAITMLALADLDARELCGDLVQQNVIVPLAAWLGGANALDRAAQLNILWTGFIAQRQLGPLRQLADDHVGPTQHWIAQITQAIVDEI